MFVRRSCMYPYSYPYLHGRAALAHIDSCRRQNCLLQPTEMRVSAAVRLGTAGRRAIERPATCVCAMNTPGSVPEYQGKHRQAPCRKVRLRATLAEADAARWLQRGKPRRPMRDAAFPGMPLQTGDGIKAKGKRTVRISNRYCFAISALMRMKCIRKGIRKNSQVAARTITEHLIDRFACRVQPALPTIRIEIRCAMILRKLPQIAIASACFVLSTRVIFCHILASLIARGRMRTECVKETGLMHVKNDRRL